MNELRAGIASEVNMENKTDCMLIVNGQTDMKWYKKMLKFWSKMNFSAVLKHIKRGEPYVSYSLSKGSWLMYKNNPCTVKDVIYEANCNNQDFSHKKMMLSPTAAYLGTFLHRKGYTCHIINALDHQREELIKGLVSGQVMTVAISTTYYLSVHAIADLVTFIRKRNKQIKIIIGGTFIANRYRFDDKETFLRMADKIGADVYIVDKQGETALSEVIHAYKTNNSLKDVYNIVYKDGKQYCVTNIQEENNSLEENLVDWSLFKKDITRMVFIRSCISCPFSCAYCTYHIYAGKYYHISVDAIEQELNALKQTNKAQHIFFTDDTFNVPVDRFKEILRMIIRNQYNFEWDSFLRCQYLDEEAVDLMKKSGCQQVFLGIESGSQKILDNMNKKAKVEDYKRALNLLKKYGIYVCCSFIIGFPGETEETVNETFQLIDECKPTFYQLNLWKYIHDAPIYQNREQYGLEGDKMAWKHNTMDARTALDKYLELYLKIEDSIHIPVFDYDLFYLYDLGMDQEQIKRLMYLFNQGIKETFKKCHKKGISDYLWEQLMAAAKCSL
ncbi:radical SAM protein [Enterocloster clostridioformis]|uniref:radical SAM protein n=1 Tax=Enterocloster clostridioformis TaxID=1531 RepID=UPI002675EEA1|nr:radical SAM protein [Enterocloster clostridioformis]